MGRGMDMWVMRKGGLIGGEVMEVKVDVGLILKEGGGNSKNGLSMNVEGRIGTLEEGKTMGEIEEMEGI
ncbi:hypothetical protein MA16_Dca026498 [Dendrobium catenatum]|uniref:Uncharacterized protein n=1 Tax=Dendrobium catenatum TaxID=906689 RepID=A0A2I0VGC8_9ASPA|nr:hypothetical protein MA16_Dca026498 [Dendrobium catenatum]